MLSLSLFGSVSASVEAEGTTRPIPLAPRLAALLAFLALGRGRYFPRTEIVQSVWSEVDATVGAGSLNTALWRLRRSLESAPAKAGDFISINRQGALALNGPGCVNLDVADFERLTEPSLRKPLERLTISDLAELRAAVTLYKGDILCEFCSEWALRERERLRRVYLDALGCLMHSAAAGRDYYEAIHHGQAILYADPLREDVHRELMRYFVLSGQRALALRQFESCREQLRRELAIHPMRETLQLYQRIADSALGQPEERGVVTAPVAAALVLAEGGPSALGAAGHVAAARQLLAQADTHLQLSLALNK
jgi:DNA-binding SARP family transcriptional activator